MSTHETPDDLTRDIRVSPDGRFLTTPDGAPFFWLADTAWALVMRMTREDADRYLEDRAAKGFTVIQMVAVGGPLDMLDTPNVYGELPLLDRDYTHPNPAYFEHVDWVIERIRALGMRVALLPVWSLAQVALLKTLAPDAARVYGEWIAARYRGKGIIWVLGGDTTPMWGVKRGPAPEGERDHVGSGAVTVIDDRPVYDALATGLIEGDGGTPIITYHPTHVSFSGTATARTSLYFGDRTWLDINMLQTSHFNDARPYLKTTGGDHSWEAPFSYVPVSLEYRSTPVRPIIDGEPRFEDLTIDLDETFSKGYFTSYDARHGMYQALFAGAAGHTYGNHSIWQYIDDAHPDRPYQLPRAGVPWQVALGRESTSQLRHAKELLLSRPYFTRIPDQSIIVGDEGRGTAHIGANRDREGRYALLYLPQGQEVTVDLGRLAGDRIVAWWFDPRTGEAARIAGNLPANGPATFTPPTSGPESDWILVLDREDAGFPPPGTVLAD